MFAGNLLKYIISFSKSALGKMRSFLKLKPTRPNSAAKIVATIINPGDHLPHGFVFAIPDGCLFYAAIAGASSEMRMDCIVELLKPHPDVANAPKDSTGLGNKQPLSKLGENDALRYTNDPAVKKLLVEAYYGKKAPQKLRELSLV